MSSQQTRMEPSMIATLAAAILATAVQQYTTPATLTIQQTSPHTTRVALGYCAAPPSLDAGRCGVVWIGGAIGARVILLDNGTTTDETLAPTLTQHAATFQLAALRPPTHPRRLHPCRSRTHKGCKRIRVRPRTWRGIPWDAPGKAWAWAQA